jgi:uncharacterized LabA/DUF88 family protein
MNNRTRIIVVIDLSNIMSAFDKLKKDFELPYTTKLDYGKLVNSITMGSEVVWKAIYAERRNGENDGGFRRFVDSFKHQGFEVVSKDPKIISLDDGTKKRKANFDVEIAVDMMRFAWRRDCDEVVLISGDSDFAYLVDEMKKLQIKITVVSTVKSLSTELADRANKLITLDSLDIKSIIL